MLLLFGGRKRGIVDIYPASVAYSLRRVRSGYNGPCITVRRSSDSAEQDIGFAPSGLIDTASLLAFCGSGSGFIRRWYTQVAGSTNHAEQSTAGLQPRIVNAGSLEVNEFGKPAIRFIDATAVAIGAHLTFDPWHAASTPYIANIATYSLLSNGAFPHLMGSNPIDRGLVSSHNNNTRQPRIGTVRSVSTFANATVISLNQTYVRHDCADRSNGAIFFDKSETAAVTFVDSNTDFNMPTKYWLGSANDTTTIVADLEIQEFLTYASDQTSNNLAIRSDAFDYWRS